VHPRGGAEGIEPSTGSGGDPARDWAHRAAELRAWRRVRREKDDTILEQGVKKSVRSRHVLTALFAGARNGGACGDAAGGFGTRNQRR